VKLTSILKRISPFYLLLLAVSPILISLLIHTTALILSSRVTWGFAKNTPEQQVRAARIILDGQRDDGLEFQGTDELDSFSTDEAKVYPLPEVEYRPIAPEPEFFPDAKVNEELHIISLEAAAMDHPWVNPSTGRQPLYTGPERLVGSFSRHIQALREGGLDVVFVFDTTASMTSFLIEVKRKIANLAGAFKKLVPTCRIGLIAYRDKDHESDFVTKVHPLTYGTASLQEFLDDIQAKGGGDREEAIEQALSVAIQEMKWNPKAKKFILLIGDAPPHKEDMPEAVGWIETFRNEMGGKLSALDTRGPKYETMAMERTLVPSDFRDFASEDTSFSANSQSVMQEFQTLTEAGGGESARLTDDEKVVKDMLLLVFGARWEVYLGEFMKNL
jgi:Mg-chelatase subunit ChlD